MFRGTHQHSIDAKGRTSLPSKFRDVLAARSETELIVTQGPERSLWCYAPSTWAEIEKKVSQMPQFDPEVRRLMRIFVMPAADCALDKTGRILVPPTLREYAGLAEGDVIWAGATQRCELWNAARFNAPEEAPEKVFASENFARTVAGLGL